jgi:hypothetical protein
MGKIQELCCWLWGHYISFWVSKSLQERWCTTIEIQRGFVICCQNLHAHFYCGKLVVELLGHVSKSQGCLSKPQLDGWICHHFTSFKNHGTTCDYSFGFLCYNIFLTYGYIHLDVIRLSMWQWDFLQPLIQLELQWYCKLGIFCLFTIC